MTTTIVLSILLGFQNGFIACWLYLKRERESQSGARRQGQQPDAYLTWLAYEMRVLGLMLGQLQDGQVDGDRGS